MKIDWDDIGFWFVVIVGSIMLILVRSGVFK